MIKSGNVPSKKKCPKCGREWETTTSGLANHLSACSGVAKRLKEKKTPKAIEQPPPVIRIEPPPIPIPSTASSNNVAARSDRSPPPPPPPPPIMDFSQISKNFPVRYQTKEEEKKISELARKASMALVEESVVRYRNNNAFLAELMQVPKEKYSNPDDLERAKRFRSSSEWSNILSIAAEKTDEEIKNIVSVEEAADSQSEASVLRPEMLQEIVQSITTIHSALSQNLNPVLTTFLEHHAATKAAASINEREEIFKPILPTSISSASTRVERSVVDLQPGVYHQVTDQQVLSAIEREMEQNKHRLLLESL